MTPVPALALLVAVAVVGLGSFLWSALVRTVRRRRARRLQRWAGDWQPATRCPFRWWRTGECFTCERRAGHRGRHRMRSVGGDLASRRVAS